MLPLILNVKINNKLSVFTDEGPAGLNVIPH